MFIHYIYMYICRSAYMYRNGQKDGGGGRGQGEGQVGGGRGVRSISCNFRENLKNQANMI
jgi:hypothetical protein